MIFKEKTGKSELLAPCGSREALTAAIKAGADAVYLGGKSFNARMNARNFDADTMREAIITCHKNGVRVYVTLNTQIYDREMQKALDYACELYNMGVDALIITDLGLIKLLREFLPELELHASTQLAGHNAPAARFCEELGMTRMVAARELRKGDIEALCAESPIEIECFVHGALCASQSGGCLFSSLVGGRSGNRGQCAQPCRLPYSGSYPLSLKDMCLASHLTELTGAGVASLKIEGRMKSPEYVRGVVGVYRRLLDKGEDAKGEDISYLASLFSRSGFTDGYFTGKIGTSMLGIRTEKDKQSDVRLRPDPTCEKKPAIICEREAANMPKVSPPRSPRPEKPIKSARFYEPSALAGRDFFDIIYLPVDRYDARANGVMLPSVILPYEYADIRALLLRAKEMGCRHLLVTNPGQFELARESGMEVHLDYRFNVYNSYSADMLSSYGEVMLSPELTLPQMRDIRAGGAAIAYGRVPLMTLERRTNMRALVDRRSVRFPVMREGAREIVFNSVPVYMADKQGELAQAGINHLHFIFSSESKEQVGGIIKAYAEGLPPQGPFTRIKK